MSALHHLVRRIENTLRYNELTISAFIDVEGTFDNTGFGSIRPATERRHIEPETVEWIIRYLNVKLSNQGWKWSK
jgi:hypothetical protein